MIIIFKNRLAYLSISFTLLLAAFPLISIGMTTGPRLLWWVGLIALTVGGLIPPLQRIFLGSHKTTPQNTESSDNHSQQQKGEKS